MKKIGRNQPCPCGSGKKYKKCCLEKDQAKLYNRPAAIAQAEEASVSAVTSKPVSDLDMLLEPAHWENESYREVAQLLVNELSDRYSSEFAEKSVRLWSDFSEKTQPQVRKVQVYAAAIEYYIATNMEGQSLTQSELADRYGVSSGTISQKVKALNDFSEQHQAVS
ncbi:SEC-C metal-binding domain-containing protein [Marinicrinis lubricantis]|uniref:SEC-C metal-binding domain-containing protein n=1 Tax=Marinicrinis lubricantis TaxID=2086470 RepID=A0ABW1IJM9_9BACL